MAHEPATDAILSHLPVVAYRMMPAPPWPAVLASPPPTGLRAVAAALEAGGGHWDALIHSDERDGAVAKMEAAIAGQRGFALVHRLPDPWDRCWLLNRAAPVPGADGAVESLTGLLVDVSDEWMAWQMLKAAESGVSADADADASQDLRWTADAHGKLTDIGKRARKALGNPADLRALWTAAIHDDDRERVLAAWRHAVESGEAFDQRYRLRLPGGDYRWFRSRGAPRRDSAGRILEWRGSLEDINEAELSLQELQRAERRYALAARATGEIVWEWDVTSDRIRRVADPALLAALGLDPEGDDQAWAARVHPDDLARVASSMAAVAQGDDETWSTEYRLRRPSGDYADILDRAFLLRDENGKPERLIGAMQDVTDRKRSEQDLRELQRELVHMAQLNAAATMATNLAHELNQPLTACANYLVQIRMILESAKGAAAREASETAARAEEQVLRAGRSIRRMRSLVRNGRPSAGGTSFDEVVAWVMKLMQVSSACPGAVLRSDGLADHAVLAAERIHVAQVMLNLASQACEIAAVPAPEINVAGRIQDGMAEVLIQTPAEIPADAAQRILAAFDGVPTADTDRLSIARTIVEAWGGRLWVSREADASVVFHFTIPLESGSASGPRGPPVGRGDNDRAA